MLDRGFFLYRTYPHMSMGDKKKTAFSPSLDFEPAADFQDFYAYFSKIYRRILYSYIITMFSDPRKHVSKILTLSLTLWFFLYKVGYPPQKERPRSTARGLVLAASTQGSLQFNLSHKLNI